jgi:prephenate dehydrogenase
MASSGSIAAVRGAVQADANTATAIVAATARLLRALIDANDLVPERIVSALFTATPDLDADFPAHAARQLGWAEVPLLGAREMGVAAAPERVVRVLLTVRDVPEGRRLTPVYLGETARLRPELAPARPTAADAPRVAIIGLGQIGGSIGLALGAAGGWRRIGWDRDAATLVAARAGGAIDEAASSLEAACARAAIAVLATPVDTLADVIDRAASALPPRAALLDTGSARAPVTPALERAAARGVRATGGHPLAGNEGSGFGSARRDLFAGRAFVLLPVAEAPAEIVVALLRDLGARAIEADPVTHDHALARTSHLAWLIACGLRDIGSAAAAAGLHGPAFGDMTRIAASDPRVADAYCRANRVEIERAWRELRERVDLGVRALSGEST